MNEKLLIKFCIIFVLIHLLISNLFAQAPDTLWTKVYGNDSISFTPWEIHQTSTGDYLLAGRKSGDNGGSYIMRLDSQGDSLWTKTYIPGSRIYSFQQTSDNYIIYTGEYNLGVFLLKTDLAGDTLWSKSYQLGNEGEGSDIIETNDNHYIIVGTVETQNNQEEICLIKTDMNGDTVWTKIFGGNEEERGMSVQQTSDNGFIIGGVSESYGTGLYDDDIYLIKTDINGIVQWEKTFSDSLGQQGVVVKELDSGGFIILGATDQDTSGLDDIYLIKTDANADTIWTKTYGGIADDEAYSFEIAPDGGFIIAARSKSYGAGNDDVYLVRTDENGNTLWTKTIGWQQDEEFPISIKSTNDGGYVISAVTESFFNNDAILIAKIEPDPLNNIDSKNESRFLDDFHLFQNFPNPFNPLTTIRYKLPKASHVTLEIYDLIGQKLSTIQDTYQNAGYHKANVNASQLASGIYLYKIQVGDFQEVKKMVVIK